MKILPHVLRLACGLAALAPLARAQFLEQFIPAPRDCTPCVWFQAIGGGGAAPDGHSGVLAITSMPIGLTLQGGWMTFTPQGTFVTLIGGTLGTWEVTTPAGAPITDVRGAIHLAAGFHVLVNAGTGDVAGVTLYSGEILWTPTHTYLVLLGGLITTYDITSAGLPLVGTRGVARLAADVVDTDPGPNVTPTLFAGAVVYSATQAHLTLVGGTISTSELQLAGAPIPGVRGVTAMGGSVAGGPLSSAAILWTPEKVLLLLTGGAVSVSEVLDPAGASIPRTWGVTRQSPLFGGGGSFQGAATIVNDGHEYLVLVGGGVSTTEVTRPAGGALASNVNVPPSNSLLHQASNLSMLFASWAPPGAPSMRGTVIGSEQ
jgi:hypothetical protein